MAPSGRIGVGHGLTAPSTAAPPSDTSLGQITAMTSLAYALPLFQLGRNPRAACEAVPESHNVSANLRLPSWGNGATARTSHRNMRYLHLHPSLYDIHPRPDQLPDTATVRTVGENGIGVFSGKFLSSGERGGSSPNVT